MTDIDNFGNSWQGLTHGEVEDAIKAKAAQVDGSINAKYTKPSGGIPASDIASGVIPDVSGKADKSEMSVGTESNGKRIVTLKSGTSVNVVTSVKTVNNESILGNGNINVSDGADGITPHIGQNGNWYIGSTDTNVKAEGEQGDSGVASADGIAVRNNTTGGYVDTDEQVNVLHANVGKLLQDEIDDLEEDFSSGIIDMHVTGDTLYITTDRSRPWIRTNRSAISFGETLSGGTGKTYRVTLTWKNLTNIISVAFKSGSDTAFTKTISSIAYVDGGRHSADIDIVFAPASGATGAKAGTLVMTSGNITVEVALSGTAATVVVPTLSVSEDELNFSAMQGQTTDSQSFVVTGYNLTADATVSVSGTGVEISSNNSTFGTSAITLQRDSNGSVNATIYVRYTAGNSDLEDGLITVSSTGANSVSVDVTGTVAEPLPVDTVVTVDGLKYKVTALPSVGNNATVSVVNGDGDAPSSYAVATNKYTMSNLVIPATIEVDGITYDVTEIGSYAFAGCDTIESISFGANINSIKAGAFYYCNNNALTSVVIPESIVNVGAAAFAAVAITHFTFLTETSFTDGGFTYVSTTQESRTTSVDFGTGVSAVTVSIAHMFALTELILRKSDAIVTCGNSSASGWTTFYSRKAKMQTDGASYTPTTVYVPASLLSSYQSDTNWASWVTDGVITLDSISNLS